MTMKIKHQILLMLTLLSFLIETPSNAGTESARQAMQNKNSPLIVMHTELGSIYIELFPAEAPENTTYFLQLIEGKIPSTSNPGYSPRYLDNLLIKQSIPGAFVQGADSRNHPFGGPTAKPDKEINANALGFDKMKLIDAEGYLHPNLSIKNTTDYEEKLLKPFLESNNITSPDMIQNNQFSLFEKLSNLSLKQGLELQGHTFTDDLNSRAISRGSLVLIEPGGPGFLLALKDLPHLDGRYTVIGHIVEGITLADKISQRTEELNAPVLLYSTRVIQNSYVNDY